MLVLQVLVWPLMWMDYHYGFTHRMSNFGGFYDYLIKTHVPSILGAFLVGCFAYCLLMRQFGKRGQSMLRAGKPTLLGVAMRILLVPSVASAGVAALLTGLFLGINWNRRSNLEEMLGYGAVVWLILFLSGIATAIVCTLAVRQHELAAAERRRQSLRQDWDLDEFAGSNANR